MPQAFHLHHLKTPTTMTEQQFKDWLKRVDLDGDGRISKNELTQALRDLGINWPIVWAWLAVFRNDLNGNHCIDGELEMKKLKEYAAKHWGIVVTAHQTMTEQQFKDWLKRVDLDGDGRISKNELEKALRALGINRATLRAWLAVFKNDLNGNNYIDGELELKKLKEYAAKHWGIVVGA